MISDSSLRCARTPTLKSGIVVGIDATNLRQGGGRTHLVELLGALDPRGFGISHVVVWGSRETLASLAERDWLKKVNPWEQERGLLIRTLWQRYRLGKAARGAQCDLLFVPGGSYAADFVPTVSMSRNMLPFEWRELFRYGFAWPTVKLLLLRISQTRTMRNVEGLTFLTEYAKRAVLQVTGPLPGQVHVIPHGLSSRFLMPPRPQRAIATYSEDRPFRLIYVSIVDVYKHQWNVVEAVARLRSETGWPLTLDLVGPAYGPARRRLRKAMRRYDQEGRWARHHGPIPYAALHTMYAQADVGVFASSCENMPNILLETMAAGLPIACSGHGPMPEILGQAGTT